MVCQAVRTAHSATLGGGPRDQEAVYTRALERGQKGQLWSSLTGRARDLLSLEDVTSTCAVLARRTSRAQQVPLAAICGSESRTTDFDREFNPLQDRTRDRWLGIAAARRQGRLLPPVALVQVGERYFVRDGHHRISVARALGQRTIEATVEVWQVDGTLPCELQARSRSTDRAARAETSRRLGTGAWRPAVLGWLAGALR